MCDYTHKACVQTYMKTCICITMVTCANRVHTFEKAKISICPTHIQSTHAYKHAYIHIPISCTHPLTSDLLRIYIHKACIHASMYTYTQHSNMQACKHASIHTRISCRHSQTIHCICTYTHIARIHKLSCIHIYYADTLKSTKMV